jgi:hypothetical protein
MTVLAAVIMNEVPELRLSQRSKIKRACRYGNEWCAAITLASRDFFVSFFIQKKKKILNWVIYLLK